MTDERQVIYVYALFLYSLMSRMDYVYSISVRTYMEYMEELGKI